MISEKRLSQVPVANCSQSFPTVPNCSYRELLTRNLLQSAQDLCECRRMPHPTPPRTKLLTNVLVGSNPNIAFYAWQFHQTNAVEITIVNNELNPTAPVSWKSSVFGNSQYTPHRIYNSLTQVPDNKYDIFLLSCSSLQDFQNVSNEIVPFIDRDSIIVIESTGYINLEPFVSTKAQVLSIMNESDVKRVSKNVYSHEVRNKDTRIYFGSALGSKSISSNMNYHRIYKLLQTIQEDSNNHISLLKSLTPTEFMTYQWKLALPRIIFSPLMVIFETEFPQDLQTQILSKPLITGLINELFKLIKKMNCKLVKGFENELNLLKGLSESYPKKSSDKFVNSPSLVYNYYNHYDLELDLLLLQPILLSDDHKLKSPYLENLYSIMCQYHKINSNDSIFFVRKDSAKFDQYLSLDEDLKQKTYQLSQLEGSIKELERNKINLDNDIIKQEHSLKTLKQQTIENESKLSTVQYEFDKKLQILQIDYDKKLKQLNEKYQKAQSSTSSDVSIPLQQPTPGTDDHSTNRDSVVTNNLTDLADIVQYGMALNGEHQPSEVPQTIPGDAVAAPRNVSPDRYVDAPSVSLPPHVVQKELELQRREQALAMREQQQQQQQQPHYPQQPYYDQQYYAPGPTHGPGPMPGSVPPAPHQQRSYYQQPPHGLPPNGMSVTSLPLKQGYPPNKQSYPMAPGAGSMNGYHHPPPPQPRRVSSSTNTAYYDHPQQYPPYQQPPPPQPQQQPAPPSGYDNGAPIDPYLEHRFKQNPKKQNRRSNMGLNMEGIDMGGRGGMPGAAPTARKSFSSQQLNSPTSMTKRSTTTMNLSTTHPNGSYSQSSSDGNNPHHHHGSQNYSQSSSSGTSNGSNDNIPTSPSINDLNAKPLGGISQSNMPGGDKLKKKKKGIFGR
ncbi:uncharacterized protein SPAPADRAFT_67043 [Spathaspora passalidarum NRRL Y-27907]|uniref:Ketopantoate reductase C-terminal domain-containing protein n=1 Tax=Spathaspora passalidarum (strain NRRL Y-27907 / 11-Y1) TaxID=619300 RepID=G3AN14_SPAPN|nr:uncharacterized protein SPAPADRAFT_67043 [Spathaspora passalidarum NRRL Y-27907]EGW32428.1 hypothetical protein SPAPADRAFT_67043 [Spathaspora passalidarum NRRL Y-27907]